MTSDSVEFPLNQVANAESEAMATEPAVEDVKPTEASVAPAEGAIVEPATHPVAPTPAATATTRDATQMPTLQYLNTTVVPILSQALLALTKERPESPIDFVANYLLKEKYRFASNQHPGGVN